MIWHLFLKQKYLKNNINGAMVYGLLISFLFSICFVSLAYSGEIYSYVDQNGVWHFTNVPTDKKFTRLEITEESAIIKGKSYKKLSKSKSKSIDTIIKDIGELFNLDPALIKAVILAESGGNPLAVSPKGALGLMQLMPKTAKELLVDDPFDPEENIWGGSKYLSELLKIYNGDVISALAAYNAGPGTVSKYQGIPPYPETINYIKKVLKYWKEAKNN